MGTAESAEAAEGRAEGKLERAMIADLGEHMIMFLIGVAVGGVLGIGLASFLRRAFGGLFSWFGTPRERELRKEAGVSRARAVLVESRVRKKDALIRQAILTVQRENRDRVARMVSTHADRAVDVVLNWFRKPPRPVPEEAIQRCREAYPDTTRFLEKALRS